MKRLSIMLFALCALTLVVMSLGSCNKLKNIKGNLAGQVVTVDGLGIGYMSVALYDIETGNEVQRQNAADSGNFFFRDVPGGKYTVKLFDISGNEMKTDTPDVKLGTGRTKTIKVTLLPDGALPEEG